MKSERWCWELPDWPRFTWQEAVLERAEHLFISETGVSIGVCRHLDDEESQELLVALLTAEGAASSSIEGEVLDRHSLQSSIRRHLGLATARIPSGAREAGMAQLLVNLFRTVNAPLTEEVLFDWHRMVVNGRNDLEVVGGYRCHPEPMQIVSRGVLGRDLVHYEAPPSSRVASEIAAFLDWFESTRPGGTATLPTVTRAALAHIRFEAIHPFEDGNGRMGRAIAEKTLAQGLPSPVMTSLADTLNRRRSEYYEKLATTNASLDATEWIVWFAAVAIESKRRIVNQVELLIHKSKLFARLGATLNPRQKKALLRLFAQGPEGFVGGLSAKNYMSITGAPPATATRDLADLVQKGALYRTGEKKSTRYFLAVPATTVEPVRVEDIC